MTTYELLPAPETAAISKLQDPNFGCTPCRIKTQAGSVKIDKNVLHDVFRFAAVVQHAESNRKDQPSIALIEDRNRVSVPVIQMRNELLIRQSCQRLIGKGAIANIAVSTMPGESVAGSWLRVGPFPHFGGRHLKPG